MALIWFLVSWALLVLASFGVLDFSPARLALLVLVGLAECVCYRFDRLEKKLEGKDAPTTAEKPWSA